jgi:uncharacterized protein involved in outer membrane biogenesis
MARTDVAPAAPPKPARQAPRRTIGRRFTLGLLALLVVALALPLLVEYRISLDALKPAIARQVREVSGLAARIEGPLYLVTGRHAGVEVHGLVVTGEHDQKPVDILQLGLLRGVVELWPLFAHEVRLRGARATDLTLHLGPSALTVLANAERLERLRAASAPKTEWKWVDVRRLDVRRARLVFGTDELRRAAGIVVEDMTLRAAAGAPLTIEAQGSFVKETMRLQLQTASLDQLRGGMRSIPADLSITLADASLKSSGAFDVDAQQGSYRVAAQGHGRFLGRVFPGFQAALGEVKEISVEGVLRTERDAVQFESVTLAAGRTRGRGDFSYREVDGRAQMRSQLTYEELDLRPWLPMFAPGAKGAVSKRDLLEKIRALQNAADIDIGWTVGRLIWPEREAQNLHASLQLDRRSALLSGSAHILAGAVSLEARLASSGGEEALRVDAQAGPLALEALHPKIVEAGFSGLVESAKLSAQGQGKSLAALVRSLEGELDLQHVDASWRPVPDAAATRIKIDRATLAATRDALKGSFSAAIDDARIALKLSSARGVLESTERAVQSAFELNVTRSSRRGLRFAAEGTLGLDPQHWVLDVKRAALGATRGSLAAKGAWKADAPLSLRASFERFDVAALDFLMFESVQHRRRPAVWQERVVLPSGLRLPAADFDLSTKRLEGLPARLTDLSLKGSTRDARLEATRFALRSAGGALRGELNADLRGTVPELRASVAGSDFDLRPGLQWLDVKIDRAFAKGLDAKIALRGARLKEIVAQSVIEVSAQELSAAIPGPIDAHRPLEFSGRLDARSEKGRLFVTAKGALGSDALSFTSRGPELALLIAQADRVPLDIALGVADSSLTLQGSVGRGPRADVRLRLAAKRTDRLLALAGVQTAARAALTASAQLKLSPPARYAFESLDLQLGESVLTGRATVDRSAKRPRIDAMLAGPRLRLRDLGIDAAAATRELEASAKRAGATGGKGAWIAPLRRFDGTLGLTVEQLLAAGEPVGRLKVGARLESGRLRIAPFVIRDGDSVFRAQGEVNADAAEPAYAVQAELKQYNLTPLLRSVDPKAVGSASLDGRVVLRSEGLGEAIIGNLDGTIDVASYAKDVGSGAIALMGASIFELTLDRLDRARDKKVNCSVGVFDVKEGRAKSRALFIDTTRLRILGNLDVNLSTGALDGGLRPYSKNPRLFNVSTPVDISGTLDHPKVSIANSALPELVIRYASPYTMLLGMLTQTENAKPDGSDDCRAAYAEAKNARPELKNATRHPFKFLPWFGQ